MQSGRIWRLRKVTLASGDSIEVPDGSIVAIVGPNNSGKSTILREIDWYLTNLNNRTVVTSIESVTEVDEEAFESWLRDKFPIHSNNFVASGVGNQVHIRQLVVGWSLIRSSG